MAALTDYMNVLWWPVTSPTHLTVYFLKMQSIVSNEENSSPQFLRYLWPYLLITANCSLDKNLTWIIILSIKSVIIFIQAHMNHSRNQEARNR